MQLSDMRTHIRSVVDITSNDIADTTMNWFIREGYDAIVYSEKRWPFYEATTTFDTVASTKDYSLSDVETSLSVTHDGVTFSGASAPKNVGMRDIAALKTANHVLEFIGYDDADVIYPLDSNTTGEPWYWTFWNDTVRLYPTPSSATTVYVRGYRNAVEFGGNTAIYRTAIADADTPDLPDPFDNVLSLYGLYRAYQQQEDPGLANQYFTLFTAELDNLRARYEDFPSPQPVVLNSRRVSRWRSQMILPARLRYSWE